MFDVDGLGSSLNEDKSVSDYDKAKIKEFENSIHYRNNAYDVDLPWLSVQSNYPVNLKVLEKTYIHLENRNLMKEYNDVFTNRRVGE